MKRILTFLAACFIAVSLQAKGVYTQYYGDKALRKQAQEWLKSGAWRNGFTKADPHKTVNAVDFYLQYQKNPAQWKALFDWLGKTDLLALPKGRIPISGTEMVASIEDDVNRDLKDQRSESHLHHIDFQYVVKGTERFGIIDHATSTANTAYKLDAMHYDYDVKKARFYDSKTSRFFLLFPGDWHIAKTKTKTADQNIRVVVVKVDYM